MKFRDPKTGEVFENICVVYERFCCKNERCSKECPLAFAKSCSEFVWEHQREAARLMGYEVIEDDEIKNCLQCGHYKQAYICEVQEKTVKNPQKADPPCILWEREDNEGDGEKTCGSCDKTDGNCYTTNPPQVKCTITGNYHFYGDKCDVKEDNMEQKDKPRLAEVLGVEVGEKFTVSDFEDYTTKYYYDSDAGSVVAVDGGYMIAPRLAYIINHPESIIRATRLTETELERCRVYGAKYLTKDSNETMVSLYSADPFAPERIGADYIGQIKQRFFPSVKPGDCICVEEAGSSE